jgi:hypothetical protein
MLLKHEVRSRSDHLLLIESVACNPGSVLSSEWRHGPEGTGSVPTPLPQKGRDERRCGAGREAPISRVRSVLPSPSRRARVPIDELVDRMAISALAVDTRQTVQHCRLGKFEIRQDDWSFFYSVAIRLLSLLAKDHFRMGQPDLL